MLSFEQKIEIFASFPELERKDVSMGRVNFHYEGSAFDKKLIGFHLHPNGNGFAFAGRLQDVDTDDRGYVNIRDYGAEELRELIARSIHSLTREKAPEPEEGLVETWEDPNKSTLTLKFEDDMWYVFAGMNLDGAFETYEEAREYLIDEGFAKR
ncbi:hypothetical protein [Cohnella yongneupensis]|uniref:Uncharacterized protein n=1 Tax=Cohnella yongneupensis TaxID=425006 RepID=A0ABW0R1N8_9BACL